MEANYKSVKWEREGGIGILTLNNPDNMNALDEQMRIDFSDCLKGVSDETDLRVIIFTGTGKAFSAGGDIELFLRKSVARQQHGGTSRW